jgi:hypothetical protein
MSYPYAKTYQVYCGNIGLVHEGDDLEVARANYDDYVKLSKSSRSRAANESVYLFDTASDSIIAEHEVPEREYEDREDQ